MTNRKRTKLPAGAITVRSNVVLDRGRWDLIPGELLYALGRSRDATRLQREEHMYYQPCSLCSRTIAEINLTGCTRCRHAPAPEAVLGAQQAHRERVSKGPAPEAEENARAFREVRSFARLEIVYTESEASDSARSSTILIARQFLTLMRITTSPLSRADGAIRARALGDPPSRRRSALLTEDARERLAQSITSPAQAGPECQSPSRGGVVG